MQIIKCLLTGPNYVFSFKSWNVTHEHFLTYLHLIIGGRAFFIFPFIFTSPINIHQVTTIFTFIPHYRSTSFCVRTSILTHVQFCYSCIGQFRIFKFKFPDNVFLAIIKDKVVIYSVVRWLRST